MKHTLIVAGHVSLDIHPKIERLTDGLQSLLVPGKLVEIGDARVTTGGAVSNTGLALHRLGQHVKLAGKIGDDAWGRNVLENYRALGAHLADDMIVDPSVATSYTICITPPGIDRMFWHCPGANHTYCADDLSDRLMRAGALLHFGYPPLMRRMYADKGNELVKMLRRAKEAGLTTSLDMSLPDPASDSGRADWPAILAHALPFVDIFVPSLDEIAYMLDPVSGMRVRVRTASGAPLGGCTPDEVAALCGRLIGMGTAVVMLKLGKQGAYVQAARDLPRLRACGHAGPADPQAWAGCALQAACFNVKVAGTTGAGDCTIAGFLAAVAHRLPPAEALRMAVGVGSSSVEQPDGARGLPPWETIVARMAAGWTRDPTPVPFPRMV
ncbi:MAG: carbohydrate kinase family protein [Kiritimatiellae bacterium]|nr:carbohydrate kinase family protein [Kiritimatiellia bacterium]